MLLFCIPHAGGSTLSYVKWKKYLDERITFVPLDLPGHITRQSEPLCESFMQVLEDLYQNIVKTISKTDEDYAIFGHSMGALLAYQLYAILEEKNNRLPKHLFFSGRWPPYVNKKVDNEIKDYDEFKKYITHVGNMDRLIYDNEKLGDYFYNIIYTDLKLLDTYPVDAKPHNINSGITVMWGAADDSMSYKDVSAWRKVAAGSISFQLVAGTHLFPIENVEETVYLINTVMGKYILNAI